MFLTSLRFLWRLSKCDGELSRNSKTFWFLRWSLRSKTGRAWIMISFAINPLLLWKYCIPYGLEGLSNFPKHYGTLLFPITTGLHTLNPHGNKKNATVGQPFHEGKIFFYNTQLSLSSHKGVFGFLIFEYFGSLIKCFVKKQFRDNSWNRCEIYMYRKVSDVFSNTS